VPIPGRAAEDGIELPRVQEFAGPQYMLEHGLDHIMRSDIGMQAQEFMKTALSLVGAKYDTDSLFNNGPLFSENEDMGQMLKNASEITLEPAMPPIISAALGSYGMVAPQGFLSGEAYVKKQDPYDQLGGLSPKEELVTRALGTGTADILGAAYAAFHQTPEGFWKGIQNGAKEGGKRMIMKTPILSDVMNIHPPISGVNRITEELFAKEKTVNNLAKYFRTWDASKGAGKINVKPATAFGGDVVTQAFGPPPPTTPPGIPQPTPTNPLYKQFMADLYAKTQNDTNAKGQGGIGLKSIWRRYGDYSAELKTLRSTNAGNYVTYMMHMEQNPDQLSELKSMNIDYKNPRAVQNYYQDKRMEVSRTILFTYRALEEQYSQKLGIPFKLEDLDPYGQGVNGQVLSQTPKVPPWADGTGTGQF
jgi:hypothetical protein